MPQSFDNVKSLRFVITLGSATFNAAGSNQVALEGFRASVTIDKGGGNMFAHLSAQIYGVSQSSMNSITTLQYQAFTVNPNTIEVYAEDGAQETLVFAGNIINAWGNYQSPPDVFLQIEAQAGYINRLLPTAPLSFQGTTDVATVMGQLATSMGYTFENNSVNVQLANPYLPGTGIDQAASLAKAAGIWWGIDDTILWITMAGVPRGGKPIPEIGPGSGLRGYPSFDGQGYITFECLFNPAITFLGQVLLDTSISRAAGQWTVVNVAHRLESIKPDGAWFSTVRCNASGLVPTA